MERYSRCIFVYELLCEIVRYALDKTLQTPVTRGLIWLNEAFGLVPLALSTCWSGQVLVLRYVRKL